MIIIIIIINFIIIIINIIIIIILIIITIIIYIINNIIIIIIYIIIIINIFIIIIIIIVIIIITFTSFDTFIFKLFLSVVPKHNGKPLWKKKETTKTERTVEYTTIDGAGNFQELCEVEVTEVEVRQS